MTRIRIISVSTAAGMGIAAAVLTGPAGAAPVTSGTPGGTTTATTVVVTPTPTQVVTTTDPVVTPTPVTPKPTTPTSASDTTTTGPVSTDPATTTSVESTAPADASAASSAAARPSAKKLAAPAVQAASGLALTIGISGFSGPPTITPGSTWTGTGSVTVIGTQGLLSGWVATARLSALTGSKGSVLTPTSATYNATGTGCSGSTVSTTVPLTSSDATIRTAGALCVIAGWNMTVAIAVPASGVLADTYSGTLTQSIA